MIRRQEFERLKLEMEILRGEFSKDKVWFYEKYADRINEISTNPWRNSLESRVRTLETNVEAYIKKEVAATIVKMLESLKIK